ncbi:hypothetical protein BcepSauron_132 [Burkholderia phage BcepSauron]|uniref:Uncharacterized protein n=1 Tax=Burkholderia phage BcepSauron TaxID=2530033 RepID=A0A482MMM8_9CAUD|nr:hypothetical protein H1O17_gp132 [Burkholderia phage BcepSauron]QBQ74512.1 hypothetical protein BcepSauron_132 [Burkholderia phage BcepSauron]
MAPPKAWNPFEPRAIDFDYVDAHGWYSVVFPRVHDEHLVIDTWLDDALSFVRQSGFTQYSWCFAHGRGKDGNRLSPVFYFRDRFEAARFSWRFSGTLKEKP